MSPRLPVLTFHAIHDAATPVAVPQRTFTRMMERLAAGGWKTLPLADAVRCLRGDAPLPPRRMLITFDDGYRSVLTGAAPVLRRLGFGATLFLTPLLLGRPVIFPGESLCPPEPALTWEEARSLATGGFDIGAHGAAHTDLRTLPDADLTAALHGARQELTGRLGVPVTTLAYPFGFHDVRVVAAARRVYDACFTTVLRVAHPGGDAAQIPRLDAHYLRFLERRGDLDDCATRAWLTLRRGVRAVRALVTGGGAA